jgi:hypothetical protein
MAISSGEPGSSQNKFSRRAPNGIARADGALGFGGFVILSGVTLAALPCDFERPRIEFEIAHAFLRRQCFFKGKQLTQLAQGRFPTGRQLQIKTATGLAPPSADGRHPGLPQADQIRIGHAEPSTAGN